MEPFYQSSNAAIYHGLSADVLRGMPENSIDAVVTDPPYGFAFMGKKWDYELPSVETWAEVLRVLKPGGHLLAFGGPRTYHRAVCRIEDAGFEIRDCLMWIFGSGFPKSLDVSKAIDKAAGAEREVVGKNRRSQNRSEGWDRPWMREQMNSIGGSGMAEHVITAPATEAAQQWDGWGTALKPGYENILIAQKPHDLQGLCAIMAQRIKESLCQLKSYAKDARTDLTSSQRERAVGLDSALWSAVEKSNTPADLLALMDTLPSGSEIPLSLSIGLSWLNTLAALCSLSNTFTTEMKTSLITDLKTLNCLPSAITPNTIIKAALQRHGIGLNASPAENCFNAVRWKLEITHGLFAQEIATSMAEGEGLRPEVEPIVLARKPLDGTVAANVQAWGVGALNIDGCRIESGNEGKHRADEPSQFRRYDGNGGTNFAALPGPRGGDPSGRWPANLIHDGSDEVVELFPESASCNSASNARPESKYRPGQGNYQPQGRIYPGDSGSAARFFYCAKATAEERNEGLDHLPERVKVFNGQAGESSEDMKPIEKRFTTKARNTHPTVKPLALMRYLCRLICPPDGLILDPFFGSGSTGVAAIQEGFRIIGIEADEHHCEIAKGRVSYAVRVIKKNPGLPFENARQAQEAMPLFMEMETVK